MAMITCPECGHDMSSSAKACPNCGFVRKLKKPTIVKILDPICIISLLVGVAMVLGEVPMIPYVIGLAWAIIYLILFNHYKKKDEYDSKSIRISLITIVVVWITTFVL